MVRRGVRASGCRAAAKRLLLDLVDIPSPDPRRARGERVRHNLDARASREDAPSTNPSTKTPATRSGNCAAAAGARR